MSVKDILVDKVPFVVGVDLGVGAGAHCVTQADLKVIDSSRSLHLSSPVAQT